MATFTVIAMIGSLAMAGFIGGVIGLAIMSWSD